jgi:tetratricopeptide (TPR) repeat protein
MTCPTTAEFADYLAGDPTHRIHILECSRCRALASALRFVDGVDDLDAAIAEMDRREAAALAAVAELESRRPHYWGTHARTDARLHSPEGVRRLLARAAESYGAMPRRALALSQVAVTCAVTGTVAPALTFNALKDFAMYSLRVADDIDGALSALDAAEGFVAVTDDPGLMAAILSHARAYVYGDSTCGQWDRALALLEECELIFEQRDPRRCRGVRHFRAAVFVRRGDYNAAADLYEHLLRSEADAVSSAHLKKDLAECYCRMGRSAEALPLASEALAVLSALGHAEVAARAKWAQGAALSGVGAYDEAVQLLEAVSRFFASAGLSDDELGAELSLIRAMLARDPAAPVVPRLEHAYMLACALDSSQPLRSRARRAEVWASLLSAHEHGAR